VNQLSGGVPVVTYQGGSVQYFAKHLNGTWEPRIAVEALSGAGARGAWTIVVTSAGKLLIHGSETGSHMNEYASTNGGATWTKTVLRRRSAENSNRWAKANIFPDLAGKERVLVQWVQTTREGIASNIVFIDRPQ
jgi:hypothetical protein